MRIPRVSLRTLLVVVALEALDFGMFRWAFASDEPVSWVNIIALPMANILILAAFRPGAFYEAGRLREDRVGFQLIGWFAMAATLVGFMVFPRVFVDFVRFFHLVTNVWFDSPAYQSAAPGSPTRLRIFWCSQITLLAIVSLVCTIIQLLIAKGGVWLASRSNEPAK